MSASGELLAKIKSLPAAPGVYLYKNAAGEVIYVGKAKNLRKRVSSYFAKEQEGKTALLVRRIADIAHVVTGNETEAFLLENVLIKKYQPKYNILLKDDKTYPWIVIRKEAFPRVEMTRVYEKGRGEYFGPYTSVRTVKVLLELIHDLFPIRTCAYDLSPGKIRKGRYKVCLEYHLGRCKAPCTGNETEENYRQYLDAVRKILKGNFKPVLEYLTNEMNEAARKLQFETAQEYLEKIRALENYQSRSVVVNPKIGNVEVYSIVSDDRRAYVNFFEVAHGTVIRARNIEVEKKIGETDAEILSYVITDHRNRYGLHTPRIIVPFKTDIPFDVRQIVPRAGDKKKLLDLSLKNAKYYRKEKLDQLKIVDPEADLKRRLEQARKDLRLPRPPVRMECFDISHTQGVEKTASCVVFTNLKPDKKEYRHFRIKTVEGNNDFASMEEVVRRRYARLQSEGKPLPDLIIIDGGKGQLHSAMKALKALGLDERIPVIGIAKRLEEIYRPGDSIPLYLDKTSETLKVIQRIRNEAHRFGLKLHRQRREKRSVSVTLTQIPGVGEKTAVKLLKQFGSLKRIREAGPGKLAEAVGEKTARKIWEHLKNM